MNELLLRRRALMMAQKKSRLPSEYQEVEYLESTGTQYIDTRVLTSNNLRILAKAVNTFGYSYSSISYGSMLFGGRITSANSNVSYSSGAGDDFVGKGNGFLTIPYNSNRGTLTVDWSNTEVRIFCGNYSFQSSLNASITNPSSIFLFAANQDGTPEQLGTYRGIHFEIWNNDIKVRDFVPCYRKSDDVAGMYDLSNSKKNLLDMSTLGLHIVTGTGVERYGVKVTNLPAGEYTLSFNQQQWGDTEYLTINDLVEETYTQSKITNTDSFVSKAFTLTHTSNVIFRTEDKARWDAVGFSNIQLEEGSTATSYEPYPFYTNAGTDEFIVGADVN